MQEEEFKKEGHEYNGSYSGKYLDRIAFPVGGMSAGMCCVVLKLPPTFEVMHRKGLCGQVPIARYELCLRGIRLACHLNPCGVRACVVSVYFFPIRI